MIENQNVLAVVPARSGSKSIPDKNMLRLGGLSLIARAARVLSAIPWIDRRVISTDSPRYVDEAQRYGLDGPFLRPEELSHDAAGALETIVHALKSCEQLDGCKYDLIILAEPTSPLRETTDIEAAVGKLLKSGADATWTVSRIDTKCHPNKILQVMNERAKFYTTVGSTITGRQQLEPLYARNGLCYCFRRETLLGKRTLLTDNTVAVITDRPVANIDEPIDLMWAEFLLERAQTTQTAKGLQ